jgi:hypothetical protein
MGCAQLLHLNGKLHPLSLESLNHSFSLISYHHDNLM